MTFHVTDLGQERLLTYKGKGELHPPPLFMLRLKLSVSKKHTEKPLASEHLGEMCEYSHTRTEPSFPQYVNLCNF